MVAGGMDTQERFERFLFSLFGSLYIHATSFGITCELCTFFLDNELYTYSPSIQIHQMKVHAFTFCA
jgi:hypothetical protein